jgi:NADH pyrophosphatase NudC (nudix superfamily)
MEREIDIKDLTLQYEEVQAVKWASKDEILKLIKGGKFIDYYFTELLFEMRKQRGGHRTISGCI